MTEEQAKSRFDQIRGITARSASNVQKVLGEFGVYSVWRLSRENLERRAKALKREGIVRVTLFADSDVIDFYKRQGWTLEPRGSKCAFWYAN